MTTTRGRKRFSIVYIYLFSLAQALLFGIRAFAPFLLQLQRVLWKRKEEMDAFSFIFEKERKQKQSNATLLLLVSGTL